MSDDGFVLDMGPERNQRFVFLTGMKGRLNIEINTGMKFRGPSSLAILRTHPYCGIRFSRKEKALRWVEHRIADIWEEVKRERAAAVDSSGSGSG